MLGSWVSTMNKITILFNVCALCVSSACAAATITGNVTVSAVVMPTCSMQSPLSATAFDNKSSLKSFAQVGVNCAKGISYTVTTDYPGATCSSGHNPATDAVTSVGNGAQQSIPLDASVSAKQNMDTESYTNLVSITLSY